MPQDPCTWYDALWILYVHSLCQDATYSNSIMLYSYNVTTWARLIHGLGVIRMVQLDRHKRIRLSGWFQELGNRNWNQSFVIRYWDIWDTWDTSVEGPRFPVSSSLDRDSLLSSTLDILPSKLCSLVDCSKIFIKSYKCPKRPMCLTSYSNDLRFSIRFWFRQVSLMSA